MMLCLFITGIDGSGKTSCADVLISRLSNRYKIVKIDGGDPYLFFNGQKRQLVKNRLYCGLQKIRPKVEKYGFGSCFILLHFLYKLCVTKYVTTVVNTDFIIFDTDMMLHPAAYSTLHFPCLRRLNASWRFKALYRLLGIKHGSLIFYLDTDPTEAMKRIEKRNRSSDPHENMRDLKRVKDEFDRLLTVASNNGLAIVRLDTNSRTVESIAGEMETLLNEKLALSPIVPKYGRSDLLSV